MVMPATATSATVKVSGRAVGVIEVVEADGEFVGFDGATHTGHRWVPRDPHGQPVIVDPAIPGPVTRQDAALLLLALRGHDHEASAKALGYGSKAGKVHV